MSAISIKAWFVSMVALLLGFIGSVCQADQAAQSTETKDNSPTSTDSVQNVCKTIQVKHTAPIKFDNMELKLMCGDPTVAAWQRVPLSQSRYFIKNFLQKRGYFFPKISMNNTLLEVQPGGKTTIDSIEFRGSPTSVLEDNFRRNFNAKVITPDLLNQAESWLLEQLTEQSRPCAKIDLKALIKQGKLAVTINRADTVDIDKIIQAPIKDLEVKALERYYSMAEGERYDARLVELATRRIMASGVVGSIFFTKTCKQKQVDLRQYVTLGPPLGVSAGFGANSEEGALLQLGVKNSRLDDMGSQFNFVLRASRKKASATADWRYYLFGSYPRLFLSPRAHIETTNQENLRSRQIKLGAQAGSTIDWQESQITVSAGPTIHDDQEFATEGSVDSRFVSADLFISIMNYNFEYYQANPRQGATHAFTGSLVPSLGKDTFQGALWTLGGQWLHNMGGYDPPFFVSGVRYALTLLTTGQPDDFQRVPASLRRYLGGQQTIRGFPVDSLPSDRLGACRTAYLGWEGRFPLLMAPEWQPFVFWDVATVSMSCTGVDELPLFYSPGIGLRWQSLIGPLRLSLARGFAQSDPTGIAADAGAGKWIFYFSLGMEF